MRLPSLVSFIGFVLLMAGTWCPLLRPLIFHSFNIYDLSLPYGLLVLLMSVIGILGVVLNKIKIVRFVSLLSFVLILVLFLGAFLKIHTSFSFIPFKSLVRFLTGLIKFKWGWYVLFTGPLLALLGSMFKTSKYSR
ncbi:MAG: hypothetical protein V4553_01445 [Bacteroidota bacterium]